MDEIIKYFGEHSFLDLLSALVVVVAIVVCIEKALKWLYDLFIKLYKKKKGHEEESSVIDKNTKEIQKLSESIENLGILLNKQYTHLDKKIDEQKEHIDKIEVDGKRRDCAVLRDRILGGMRYFSQNKDENGVVHISFTDYENMSHLFAEYFACGGNGSVKHIYDQEFKMYIIDK